MSTSENRPLATFDWTEFDGPSMAVVSAVADESDTDLQTMAPIYEAVDPDSLDHLFTSAGDSPDVPNGSVRFGYHGYAVVVNANGRGHLYEREEDRRSTAELREPDITTGDE